MANIIDYVKWRGDLSFAERSFTVVDNLVFSHLAYVDFNSYLKDRSMTIEEIYRITGENILYKCLTTTNDDKEFFKACAFSKRFSKVKVLNFVEETDPKTNIQFAAMTFEMDDGKKIIIFRGTDETIVGWKEDFMLSYTPVPAQKRALEYLSKALDTDEKFFVAGHSKGANLALYSASYINEDKQNKITKIYLNDGPGFCDEVLDNSLIKKIDSKCVRIVPTYAVVGKLFEPQISESYIVNSYAAGLDQHTLTTWKVDAEGLCCARDYDPDSYAVNNIFKSFIESMDKEHRESFVSLLFDTMQENGAVTIADFMKGGPAAFENVLIKVVGEDDTGKSPVKHIWENVRAKYKKRNENKDPDKSALKWKIFRMIAFLLMGILCMWIPKYLIRAFIAFALFAVTMYQVVLTIIHLAKNKWNLAADKLRINICIIMIVFFVLLLIKGEALFVFTSGIFGIFFLMFSNQCLIKFKEEKTDRLRKNRYLFEVIMTFLLGAFILVAPDMDLTWYTYACGVFFIIDFVFEVIDLIRGRK